jgi:hypothetical protein
MVVGSCVRPPLTMRSGTLDAGVVKADKRAVVDGF